MRIDHMTRSSATTAVRILTIRPTLKVCDENDNVTRCDPAGTCTAFPRTCAVKTGTLSPSIARGPPRIVGVRQEEPHGLRRRQLELVIGIGRIQHAELSRCSLIRGIA